MNALSILLSIQNVKGVGPKKVKLLQKLNVFTIEDLLYHFPRGYEDRRNFSKLSQCKDGEKVNLNVIITGRGLINKIMRKKSVLKVPVKDDSGNAFLVFYNQDYLINFFKHGDKIKVNGKAKIFRNEIQIHNCSYEKNGTSNSKIGSIIPIYPLTDKLTNNEIIKLNRDILKEYFHDIKEILPKYIIDSQKLIELNKAINNIHFPMDKYSYLEARKRLVFDELLTLQLGLLLLKNKNNSKKGIKFEKAKNLDEFIELLPFRLTNAQLKVVHEIINDMGSNKVMNRLVQGDVGSGKTIVAIIAMFNAFRNDYQSVMMAPTEILATQHFESITSIFSNYNLKCELLIGSLTKKKKNEVLDKIKNGETDIVIGTHAVIQENIEFHKLGLAITDEQHRFGVSQRASLSNKGNNPDVLVMTATPIPRTLSLILYGDLDISIIDELPPGRKKVKTYSVDNTMRERVYKFLKEQVLGGRQAYIVCPLVEESENMDLQSATELFNELQNSYLSDLKLGLLHGKMKSSEKDNIMSEFKKGNLDVLISTTVIEVGVNVPNANIMIIENSERFGLAQLHQLRGRVGRGEYQSYNILINNGSSKISKERMKIMENTTDGFIISEKDLELRGPGEVFGTKQHGVPTLKIADLFKDIKILQTAQNIALEIIENDALLISENHIKLKEKINSKFEEKFKDISLN